MESLKYSTFLEFYRIAGREYKHLHNALEQILKPINWYQLIYTINHNIYFIYWLMIIVYQALNVYNSVFTNSALEVYVE